MDETFHWPVWHVAALRNFMAVDCSHLCWVELLGRCHFIKLKDEKMLEGFELAT